jgi:MFS family permease
MLGVFLHSEKNAKEPVLPLHLFKNSVFNISSIEMFLSNAVMYCGTVYIPLFMEDVKGFSASSSGIFLTSMLVSLTLASIITGQLISRTGTYKKFAVLGFSLLAASMLLFSSVGVETWIGTVVIYAALLGLGSGMMYPIFNAAAQNAVSKRELGVVTASMQFFRNIGSTVALPIFGVIVNLTVNMNASTGSVAPSLMSAGIHNVFLSGLIISVVGLGICFLLEDVFLSSKFESGDSEKHVTGK